MATIPTGRSWRRRLVNRSVCLSTELHEAEIDLEMVDGSVVSRSLLISQTSQPQATIVFKTAFSS